MSLLLPTRRMLLMGGDGYLLREEWNGSSVSPGRWTRTDTESKLTVSGGELVCAGALASPALGDPGLVSVQAFVRRPGLTFTTKIKKPATNTFGPYLIWMSGTDLATVANREYAVVPNNAGLIKTNSEGGTLVGGGSSYSADTSIWLRQTLKATGCLVYASSDGQVWKIVWDHTTGTESPLRIGWDIGTSDTAYNMDWITVRQGAEQSPVLYDTFTDADGTDLANHTLESGGVWTETVGTWDIVSNQLRNIGGTLGHIASRDIGALDYLIDCDVYSTDWANVNPQVAFRMIDSNNLLFIAAVGAPTNLIYLIKRDGGANTELASTAWTPSDSTTYTYRAHAIGNRIDVYVDGAAKISYTLTGDDATKFNGATATLVGARSATNDAAKVRWDNYKVQT